MLIVMNSFRIIIELVKILRFFWIEIEEIFGSINSGICWTKWTFSNRFIIFHFSLPAFQTLCFHGGVGKRCRFRQILFFWFGWNRSNYTVLAFPFFLFFTLRELVAADRFPRGSSHPIIALDVERLSPLTLYAILGEDPKAIWYYFASGALTGI